MSLSSKYDCDLAGQAMSMNAVFVIYRDKIQLYCNSTFSVILSFQTACQAGKNIARCG